MGNISNTRELLKAGGPGGYDIYVDPTAMRTVSSYFKQRLADLQGQARAFASKTRHQDGEFGRLPFPETQQANDQYVQVQSDAVKGLNDLTTWLGQIADVLELSADLYERADGVQ